MRLIAKGCSVTQIVGTALIADRYPAKNYRFPQPRYFGVNSWNERGLSTHALETLSLLTSLLSPSVQTGARGSSDPTVSPRALLPFQHHRPSDIGTRRSANRLLLYERLKHNTTIVCDYSAPSTLPSAGHPVSSWGIAVPKSLSLVFNRLSYSLSPKWGSPSQPRREAPRYLATGRHGVLRGC